MFYDLLTPFGRHVGDHLWQSTLFAAAIGLLAPMLRSNRARVRYRLWLAASLKFLIPFSCLTALGARLASWFAPAATAPHLSFVVDEVAKPFAPLRQTALIGHATLAQPAVFPGTVLLAFWGFVCAAVLFYSWRRWRRVRAIVRSAAVLETRCAAARALGIHLVSSPAALEPGVFGIFRPVLFLPQEIASCLSEAELDAVLAHEFCHVRHRDNLTAAMHLSVEAVFWFHPLVWWLGARLIAERERACDEEVLRLGIEPRVYAEGILQVCTVCLKSPLACVSGVTGSSLKKRIEGIMTGGTAKRLTLGRKLLLAGAALVAIIGPVTMGAIGGAGAWAQSLQTAIVTKPSGPRFEVASIKPVPLTGQGMPAHAGIKIDGARVDIGYWSIRQLILRAYGLPSYRLSGPEWMYNVRFDVAAKFPEGATRDQLPQMLQWLLAERFGLVAHSETRELPALALAVAKGGPKMRPADPDADFPAEPVSPNPLERAGRTLDSLWSDNPSFGLTGINATGGNLHMEFQKLPMDALAQILASHLRMPVIDVTGLTGKYRVTLDLASPDTATAGGETPTLASELSGVSVFSMVQRLGLKLEPRKTPVAVLVVDRVERVPTAN